MVGEWFATPDLAWNGDPAQPPDRGNGARPGTAGADSALESDRRSCKPINAKYGTVDLLPTGRSSA
jgi:hypothetical protein